MKSPDLGGAFLWIKFLMRGSSLTMPALPPPAHRRPGLGLIPRLSSAQPVQRSWWPETVRCSGVSRKLLRLQPCPLRCRSSSARCRPCGCARSHGPSPEAALLFPGLAATGLTPIPSRWRYARWIGAVGFQKLLVVRCADRLSINEKRARPLVCFFGGVRC